MTFRRKVFTSQKITLYFGSKEVRVQALVSPYGVKYAFDEHELPDEARISLGQEIRAVYKSIPVKCRLVKESTAAGTVYSLRFVGPSNLLLKQIDRDIRESGLPSPFMRSLPRLTTENKNLPIPVLVVLYYRGEMHYVNVKNFTLGGLLLEFVGPKLQDILPTMKIEFDIVTNFGDKIADVNAVVSNVSVEVTEHNKELNRYYFGVRLLPMSLLNETKYRTLIREHVMNLRVQDQATGSEG